MRDGKFGKAPKRFCLRANKNEKIFKKEEDFVQGVDTSEEFEKIY
jgi:hypothetical protein